MIWETIRFRQIIMIWSKTMNDNFILTVNNFGPIESAKIDLAKINVVGGKNSTGKSTASKLLYCFLKANASDRQEIAFKSIIPDLKAIARNSKRALKSSEKFPDLFKHPMNLNDADYDSVVNEFYELKDILDEELEEDQYDDIPFHYGGIIDDYDVDIQATYYHNQFIQSLQYSVENIGEIFKKIDDNSLELSSSLLKKLLGEEFSVQFGRSFELSYFFDHHEELVDAYGLKGAIEYIQNDLKKDVSNDEKYGEFDKFITLTSGNSFCKLNIDKSLFESTESIHVNDVFYIDSFSLFDSILFEGFSNTVHLKQLTEIFKNTKQPKRLFDVIINENIIKIEEEIKDIIQGRFEYSLDGMTFNSSNHSHTMKNTASGLKQFGIIQILLQSRKLTPNTYLIMDEPEVNLHPEWQIKFANILVLLAKSLDIHIYINSHSPLFINAIEAYTEYYDMQDDTNYYLTRPADLGKNIFEKIDADDLYEIYDELGQPYHKLNILNLKNRY